MEMKLPMRTDCQFLTCHTESDNSSRNAPHIIIAPITQELEDLLDSHLDVIIKTEDFDYLVTPSKVLTYGDVDFNNEDDKELIYALNLNINSFAGFALPSNYNYKNHTVEVERGMPKFYQTWDNLKIVKYKYAALGKPKKVIIFKVRR